MLRFTTFLSSLLVTLSVTTASAMAQESGAGYLRATEKVITQFGLGLIVLFPIFVWFMSRVQGTLDKRKDRKKAAYRKAKGNAAWRGGW